MAFEVVRYPGKRLYPSLGPLVRWLQDHGVTFAMNEHRLRVETKLFGRRTAWLLPVVKTRAVTLFEEVFAMILTDDRYQ